MQTLAKSPTGITGLDDILCGGLPEGRPTLICGGPGSGKTLLAMEFLCRGALEFDQPGLMVSFEETEADIKTNFSSLKVGFEEALAANLLDIMHIPLHYDTPVETGEFTFDALLLRIHKAMQKIGANRLVVDSLEALFSCFDDSANLRFQISKIIQWIKEQKTTAIITSGFATEDKNTTNRLQEYIADCVLYLDHRINNQISKRRLRVIKYRGSLHGTDEYPFLLTEAGISLLPITALDFTSHAPDTYVSTGIAGLDQMFGEMGMYTGSITLLSGGPGTGKSTIAARMALASCERGGRSLLFSFEESEGQIVRNMRSVGMELKTYIDSGSLRILPTRPGRFGLEEHLVRIHDIIKEVRPDTVVLDPITSFSPIGGILEIQSMLTRLLDYIKSRQINTVLTCLISINDLTATSDTEVSSIVDNWLLLLFPRQQAKKIRQIYIYKARGLKHSHDMGELVLSDKGVFVYPASNRDSMSTGVTEQMD